MKNKASGLLKQIITVVTSMAKAKTMALKTKTNAIKTRIIIFSLLRNKKIMMSSISDKLQALLGHHQQPHHENLPIEEEEEDVAGAHEQSNAIVLHNAMTHESIPDPTHTTEFPGYFYGYEAGEKEEKYPDLTHSLFEAEDLEFEDLGGSVIDLVKNSKQDGEEFRLEDEIDQVADLFIKRFHRQMRLQKQQSFKRHQEMLERSA